MESASQARPAAGRCDRELDVGGCFLLVVFALGFFTSARIAEQVRAGIQSLPSGQRMAGLAMGLTLPGATAAGMCPGADADGTGTAGTGTGASAAVIENS